MKRAFCFGAAISCGQDGLLEPDGIGQTCNGRHRQDGEEHRYHDSLDGVGIVGIVQLGIDGHIEAMSSAMRIS